MKVSRVERAKRRFGIENPLDDVEFLDDDDFIGEFLKDLKLKGRRSRTLKNYRFALRDLEDFLRDENTHIGKTSERQVMRWKILLQERGLKDSTITLYLQCVSAFFDFLVESWVYPHVRNPAKPVLEAFGDGTNRNPHRRRISLDEMSDFVRGIHHPRDRAIIVLFLKTGIRNSELRNLEMNHVSVGDDLKQKHPAVEEKSIFVDSRIPGNKRKVDTTIPLDGEAIRALKTWLAIRSDNGSDHLFLTTNDGSRLGDHSIRHIVAKYARKRGWYKTGGGAERNVTPHYFRHFFTTQLRVRGMPDIFVDYLRGDSPKTTKDTYTHLSWEEVKSTYEEYIYKFGI